MKIALVPSAFHPSLGGVEELSRQLAHALKKRGHDVLILTDRWPRDLPEREEFEGLRVVRMPMRGPEPNRKAQISFALTHRAIEAKFTQEIRDFGADLVHLQCVSTNGHYALRAARALKLPLFVMGHGEISMDAGGSYARSPFLHRVLAQALDEAAFVCACSQNTLAEMARFYESQRGPGQKWRAPGEAILNGISLREFEISPPFQNEWPYIFALGRLVPQKGFDLLLEALAQSGTRELGLILAGEGPEKSALEASARARGLEKRVRFWGRAARAEVVALMKGCEFFALPSRLEPLGIVNLEAMACGAAILAANSGGVSEIVSDGENGLLVPPDDAPALAQKIAALHENADLRRQLGQNGRARAENFDWNVVAARYEAAYGCALHSKTK